MLPLILGASFLIYLAVAWNDLFHRSIPNFLSFGIAGLAVLRMALAVPPGGALWAVVIALIVFAVALLCFARGWLGGGDVKLLTATILLIGARDSLPFLICMAIAGGILSVLVLLWAGAERWRTRHRAAASGPTLADTRVADTPLANPPATPPVSVPYGIAISLSAVLALFSQFHQL